MIVHVISGLRDGGAEGTLYRLCRADQDIRHHVISFMGEEKYATLLREAGVEVHCLDMPAGRLTFNGLVTLWRMLRQLRPDVVQTWMYHADLIGGLVARVAGVKKVCWGVRHSTISLSSIKLATMFVASVCAALSRLIPDKIICCAERAAQSHRRIGYSASRMVVIHNGYDLSLLRPDEPARSGLRAEWGIGESTPLLGMVARYHPHKDHKNLIDAMRILKTRGFKFVCVLVGSGVDETNDTFAAWLTDADLSQSVIRLGARSDVPAIMSALDIHVLSSAGEAFPNVLAEAMACGTPCVTTDVGDAAEIVGATGWVVPSRDSGALADAIQAAISERKTEGWHLRRLEARQRILDEFSIDTMIERYHAAWGCK